MQPNFNVTLDANQLRAALKALKQIEPEAGKVLSRELKSKMSPIAKQVADAVPLAPPLSGFGNQGRTGWGPAVGKVSFTPGRSKKTGMNLLAIKVSQRDGRAGLNIAELKWAGSGNTASGRNMIAVLNQRFPTAGRGGRFVYAKFRMLRPDVVSMAERILNKAFERLEDIK
jgi:hypothetical protein